MEGDGHFFAVQMRKRRARRHFEEHRRESVWSNARIAGGWRDGSKGWMDGWMDGWERECLTLAAYNE